MSEIFFFFQNCYWHLQIYATYNFLQINLCDVLSHPTFTLDQRFATAACFRRGSSSNRITFVGRFECINGCMAYALPKPVSHPHFCLDDCCLTAKWQATTIV